ncbi:MAG TPA: NAD(P)/FAD-dependent oxidoreductase [Polyangiaceae bacterium]
MTLGDPDIVVIGSGHNGLVAANVLARRGFRVLVLEAHPRRPGGALGSEALTLPGFVHDVGAAFFPFGRLSPAFRDLKLEDFGVEWKNAPIESAHPAADGSVACIIREGSSERPQFGSHRDEARWRKLVERYRRIERPLLDALLLPFPAIRPLLSLGPGAALHLLRIFTSRPRRLAERLFESEAARRVIPALGLHVDVGPDDRFGSALGYMLAMTATTNGYAVPRGGAAALTNALVTAFERYGGRLVLGAEVGAIIADGRRAAGVRLTSGEEVRARFAVLANTAAPTLLLRLCESARMPARVVRRMRAFEQGWGTFKMDWALSGPVPWSVEAARNSAVVHAGDSIDDLARFTSEVRAGRLPENPYLVIGQQSLLDPSRAPEGRHTLYAYTHVPNRIDGGWPARAEHFADVAEARIERLAPGFRSLILARHVASPPDLEAMDQNLIGGDLGGGSNAWNHQLLFRPLFPYFRYRMPLAGLYLCSSYAHPGAGVHGMCGYNAALTAARDLERARP